MTDENNYNVSVEEMRNEIWETVAIETAELLETIELCLLELEEKPKDSEIINQLFRAFHTFKGSAGMMALLTTEKISHCAEDLMVLVRDQGAELTSEIIDLFFVTLDKLQEAREYAVKTQTDISMDSANALIEQLTEQKMIALAALEAENDSTVTTGAAEPLEAITPTKDQPSELVSTETETETETENLSESSLSKKTQSLSSYFEMAWVGLTNIRKLLEQLSCQDNEQKCENTKIEFETQLDELMSASDHVDFTELIPVLEQLKQKLKQPKFDVDLLGNYLSEANRLMFLFEDQNAELLTQEQNQKTDILADFIAETVSAEHENSDDDRSDNETYSTSPSLVNAAFFEKLWPMLKPIRSSLETLDHNDSDLVNALVKRIEELQALINTANLVEFNADVDLIRQLLISDNYDLTSAANILTNLYSSFWDLEDQVDSLPSEPIDEPVIEDEPLAQSLTEPTDNSDELQGTEQTLLEVPSAKLEIQNTAEESQKVTAETEQMVDGHSNLAAVFRQWHLDKFSGDLAFLAEQLNQLDIQLTSWLKGTLVEQPMIRLAPKIHTGFDAIYKSCVFYKLSKTAGLTLSLNGLFARAAIEQSTQFTNLIAVTRNYIEQVKVLSVQCGEAGLVDEAPMDGLLEQYQTLILPDSDKGIHQLTLQFLQKIQCPQPLLDALNIESTLQVGKALTQGHQLFIISTQAELDKKGAVKPCELVESSSFNVITEYSVTEGGQQISKCLISTCHDEAEIASILRTNKTIGERGALSPLRFKQGIRYLRRSDELKGAELEDMRAQEEMEQYSSAIPQTVGQLIASHATLSRLTGFFSDTEVFDLFEKHMNKAEGNWKKAKNELKKELSDWEEHLRSLFQTQEEIGKNLEHLQGSVTLIRERPLGIIVPELQTWFKDQCARLDKNITLELQGEDTLIDLKLLKCIEQPIRQLALFAITSSIETPHQRKQSGKPTTAKLSIRATSEEGYVLIDITDDGEGLDHESVQQQANKQGLNYEPTNVDQLLFSEGFGLLGGCDEVDGLDFYALKQRLVGNHISLILLENDQPGFHCQLKIPLSSNVIDGMVVQSGNTRYVIPIHSIRRIIGPDEQQLLPVSIEGGNKMLKLEKEIIQIRDLSRNKNTDELNKIMVVIQKTPNNIAVSVDHLIGMQQVMVTPKNGQLEQVKLISGCAILGRNDVGMVLDVNQL